MRLALPKSADVLWKSFDPKVRNQVRKGEKHGFVVAWGGVELLDSLLRRADRKHARPRHAGVRPRPLPRNPGRVPECCRVVRPERRTESRPRRRCCSTAGARPEVPTASALKELNPTCVNMLMYWQSPASRRGARAGRVRLRPLDRRRTDLPLQEAVGRRVAPGGVAVRGADGEARELRPDNPRTSGLFGCGSGCRSASPNCSGRRSCGI